MNWFLLAILGHLSNGVSFVIDKALLTSALKKSATYACLIGTLSLAVLVASPWVSEWPSRELIPAVIGFGVAFVFGLWAFFEALKRGEPSRVVPIVGSLIPVLTLLGTTVLFAERLAPTQLLGFFLLLSATWLLTTGSTRSKIDRATFGFCVLAAFLFASATLFGKFAFEHGDFLGVFVSSRVAAGMTGILIGLLVPSVGKEILSIFKTKKKGSIAKHSAGWAIVGQLFGSTGFILVHLAIKSGSAAIVNALQAVQYAFLVIMALILKKYAPRLLGETLDRRSIIIKVVALIVTAAGLALVV